MTFFDVFKGIYTIASSLRFIGCFPTARGREARVSLTWAAGAGVFPSLAGTTASHG